MRRSTTRYGRATCAAVLTLSAGLGGAAEHHLPFVPSASDGVRQGFVRVVNRDDNAGEVAIVAYDDAGTRFGPVKLSIDSGATVHFNSEDVEAGNAAKGLPVGTGRGDGDWRLMLSTGLHVEIMAYVRTSDGFLTAMHDVVGATGGDHDVAFFNPGRNPNQVSILRLANLDDAVAEATIAGIDDGGVPAGEVAVAIPANGALTVTASDLESGSGVLSGALGTGQGKWRLRVRTEQNLHVMSLLLNPTGHLTNLSTVPVDQGTGKHAVALFPARSAEGRQGFVRVVNRGGRAGEVAITAYDDRGFEYGPVTLDIGVGEAVHINSDDLEDGNADKGLSDGVGSGHGDWRLELSSDLHIDVLAYVRTSDGFLTAMHDAAPASPRGSVIHVFNPGSNLNQVSMLRLVNPGTEAAAVEIRGIDDAGEQGGESLRVSIPRHASSTFNAQDLEWGAAGFDGALGDGAGKWRLVVTSDRPVVAMSLLESPTGHLTNLSRGPRRGDDFLHIAGGAGIVDVEPLQPLAIAVDDYDRDAEYIVRMDLTGAGDFADDETVEFPGLVDNARRIVIAAPLRAYLPATNTDGRVAVRYRKEPNDEALPHSESGTITLQVAGVDIPADRVGYPTTVLELLTKAIYAASDDSALQAEVPNIWPGVLADASRTLGVDMALADEHAEATLRQYFGVSAIDQEPAGIAAAPGPWAQAAFGVRASGSRSNAGGTARRRTAGLCGEDALDDSMDLIRECLSSFSSDSYAASARSCDIKKIGRSLIGEQFACIFDVQAKFAAIGKVKAWVLRRVLKRPIDAQAVTGLVKKIQYHAQLANGVLDAGRILHRDDDESLLESAFHVVGDRLTDGGVTKAFDAAKGFADALESSAESLYEDQDSFDGERDGWDAEDQKAFMDLEDMNYAAAEDGGHFQTNYDPSVMGGGCTATHPPVGERSGHWDQYNACEDECEADIEDLKSDFEAEIDSQFGLILWGGLSVGTWRCLNNDPYMHATFRRTSMLPLHREQLSGPVRARMELDCGSVGTNDDNFDRCLELRDETEELRDEIVDEFHSFESGQEDGFACGPGYRQFDAGANATCIHESIVYEPEGENCYAGSRRSKGDVGEANVCVYHSRDYLQAGDSCRENYKQIVFKGRTTCRWADLRDGQPVSYSVHKDDGIRHRLVE